METIVIIALVVIVLELFNIDKHLRNIQDNTYDIKEMAEMSDKQKQDYNLQVDEPEIWNDLQIDRFATETKKKEKNNK